MAKCTDGIMGPFSGKVGTVVGYVWNGKQCMRAYNPDVRNPRTSAQKEHRELFKQEVQLAAQMRWAVGTTLRDAARGEGMTAYNLFVRLNQHAFGHDGDRLTVDYPTLVLSVGDAAPVRAEGMEWSADNVLTVNYERGLGKAYDHVSVYVYVPDLGTGYMCAPAYRRDKRVAAALPDSFAGHTAHVYLMTQSADGRWSRSTYAGSLQPGEAVATAADEPAERPANANRSTLADSTVANAAEGQPSAAEPPPEMSKLRHNRQEPH